MKHQRDNTARLIVMHFILVLLACLATTKVPAAPAVQQPAATLPLSSSPTHTGVPATRKPGSRVASGHVLVQLEPNAAETAFLNAARGLGLHKIKRLRGTNWYTMRITTSGIGPRKMANSARGLPGVLHAAADPILTINDQIPPRDPYYLDDPDPGNDCDIIEDPACTAEDLVDQWGLFKVAAEGGWIESTGSPETVIAITDTGIDFDHDDL
jgi:hypothetical protein